MYRFGLPPESIKSRLVEVSGGKAWFPSGREAPRTIIEAFAGHVDIVAVEHAMNKARRHIGCREVSRIFHYLEIGRASCRERVCQYVSITVVADSLKKKTN